MKDSLGLTTFGYAIALTLWATWSAISGRARSPVFTAALIVLEIALVLQAVLDAGSLHGARQSELATHVGYLVTSLLLIPVTAAAVKLDRGRWGSAAMAVGCLLVAVVTIRLRQTLGAAHG